MEPTCLAVSGVPVSAWADLQFLFSPPSSLDDRMPFSMAAQQQGAKRKRPSSPVVTEGAAPSLAPPSLLQGTVCPLSPLEEEACGDALSSSDDDEGEGDEGAEDESADGEDTCGKRRKGKDQQKLRWFRRWLALKERGKSDPLVERKVAALHPEDLYGHFLEFEAQDDGQYEAQVRYERECAERALEHAPEKSWLLRRSSLNRSFSGRLEGLPPTAQDFEAFARLRPAFYAFTFSEADESGEEEDALIRHMLIVNTQWHGWSLAEMDRASGVVSCRFFFTGFVSLLGHLLDKVGAKPAQMLTYNDDDYRPVANMMR